MAMQGHSRFNNNHDMHNEMNTRKNENQKVDTVSTNHDPTRKRRKKHLDKQSEDDDHQNATSSATMCTAYHRLKPYSADNEYLASFDEHSTVGEECSSCAFEFSTSIDSSNTSTSQIQHASFSTPVHVLLQDTMHQLSISNTVSSENVILKKSKDTKDNKGFSEQSSSTKQNSEEIFVIGPIQETEIAELANYN